MSDELNLDDDMKLDDFLSSLDEKVKGDAPASSDADSAASELDALAETEVKAEVSDAVLSIDVEGIDVGDGVPETSTVEVNEVAAEPEQQPEREDTPPKPSDAAKTDEDPRALKTFIDPDELRKDVNINPADLDNAMIQHASLYVHYATQTVNARRQYDRIKSAVEILEAQLDDQYRKRAADEGKKTTEALLKNQITADPRYASAQQKLIEAHSIWKLADVAERAMEQRKDLLLEVARDRRKEKEGQARVMEMDRLKESYTAQARQQAKAA